MTVRRLEDGGHPRAAGRAAGGLRPCADAECRRFLLDRSRTNTARWCSMAVRGNRMKAGRHHRRTLDGAGAA
ncbi:CGNR zinc finger domain-containing protein [Streptomyces olivochromogenes]|uniref:CGNR zinc finger domain-containing protein n=1 Tax=Streptomyces olivochromogenes TaxID=1963 RepID=UPI0035B15AE1|nr:CGNR zinc finger domain-containing protein [Streptomyces olivochromogenes]